MRVPIFSGKGGWGIFCRSLGKISRENHEKGVHVIDLPTLTNTRDRGAGISLHGHPFPEIGGPVYPCMDILFRDRGVQVMGNQHRYPLVLWEWGGGGCRIQASRIILNFMHLKHC